MKRLLLLVSVLLVLGGNISRAQLSLACSCKKFPYWYCQLSGPHDTSAHVTWCTSNPQTDGPGPGFTLMRAAKFYSCIRLGDIYACGFVVGGSNSTWTTRPGIIPDSGSDRNSIGDLFFQAAPDGHNLLEYGWSGSGGMIRNCLPNAQFDSACCINVLFRSEPSWWQTEMQNPNFNLHTGALGEVTWQWDSTNCQITCNPNNPDKNSININTTTQFLTDQDDPQFIPISLTRCYVNFSERTPVSHGLINVGIWDGSTDSVYMDNAYDFKTIVLHEMLHWSGLPDRGEICKNTSSPCGSDKNSVMSPLGPGICRYNLDDDDCCWLTKLMDPGKYPPCANGTPDNMTIPRLRLRSASPNPTTGETTISFISDRSAEFDLTVYDILGRTVLSVASHAWCSIGDNSCRINTSALPSGKYIYALRVGSTVLSKELVVVK